MDPCEFDHQESELTYNLSGPLKKFCVYGRRVVVSKTKVTTHDTGRTTLKIFETSTRVTRLFQLLVT